MTFFKSFEQIKGPVVLAAHNGRSFDTRVLRFDLAQEKMTLPNNIIGFVDTLWWAKQVMKRRTRCALDKLLNEFDIDDDRDVHGALIDSILLREACHRLQKGPLLDQATGETLKGGLPDVDCFETIQQWEERTAMCVSAKAYVGHVRAMEQAKIERRIERERRRRERESEKKAKKKRTKKKKRSKRKHSKKKKATKKRKKKTKQGRVRRKRSKRSRRKYGTRQTRQPRT